MIRRNAILLYAILLVGITALDLWSKVAVFEFLDVSIGMNDRGEPVPAGREVVVIPGFFDLEPALNPGAFSGWFSGQSWLLIGVSSLAVVVTALMISVPRASSPLVVTALGCIAGGALGNLYDRVTFGYVRDFVKWYVTWDGDEHVWPNFNIADSAICVGFGLVVLAEILHSRARRRAARAAQPG